MYRLPTLRLLSLLLTSCVLAGWGFSVSSATPQDPATPVDERAMIEGHIKSLRQVVAGPAELPRPEVLLFGCFHFANPGLDAHKSKYTFNVFSEKGQRELTEVLDRLAAYQPTKILIETASSDQAGVDAWYEGYKKGNFAKNPNESLTVGCALAQRLGHQRIYGFDARPRWLPNLPETREQLTAKAKAMGMEDRLKSIGNEKYGTMYKVQDEIAEKLTLRQRLLLMNHPETLRLSHGAYFFFANFELADGKEFPGPDSFCSAWHNRNLRMFSNIQRLASEPKDRLLVVVGAGHVPLLQHCVQTCPTMKWIDLWTVLGAKPSVSK